MKCSLSRLELSSVELTFKVPGKIVLFVDLSGTELSRHSGVNVPGYSSDNLRRFVSISEGEVMEVIAQSNNASRIRLHTVTAFTGVTVTHKWRRPHPAPSFDIGNLRNSPVWVLINYKIFSFTLSCAGMIRQLNSSDARGLSSTFNNSHDVVASQTDMKMPFKLVGLRCRTEDIQGSRPGIVKNYNHHHKHNTVNSKGTSF